MTDCIATLCENNKQVAGSVQEQSHTAYFLESQN